MSKPVQPIRWKPLELIGVLTYLNNNFELWCANHRNACNMAIRETNINRDEKATYAKIYNLIRAMEEFHQSVDDDIEMSISDDQTNIDIMSQSIAPLSIEAVNKLCDEKINQVYENQALVIKKIEEANDTFEKSNVKIFYSAERAKSICDEKLSKIGQLRSELIEMINIANAKYEELKNFQ
ncbi:2414_t:CDS:2 [Rhizophagus irregularis]|nr:2414_t:CDS:2 [Rhizophagus irregularis]